MQAFSPCETGAWNVGGVVRAAGTTPGERAVACAMDSAFGGIGWTRAESAGGRAEVDTVTYGAFRREAFERAGLYDETLIRNQDDELNLRLRLAGGTIVLDPAIEVFYTPRASWRRVFRQYYEYGLWKIPVMLRHRRVLSARSLAPAAFVLGLIGGALLGLVWRPAWALTAAVVAVYAIAALGFAVASVRRRGEPAALVPRVVAVYTAFHVGYGVGMLHGALRALLRPAAPAGGPPQLERLPQPGHEGDEAHPERP